MRRFSTSTWIFLVAFCCSAALSSSLSAPARAQSSVGSVASSEEAPTLMSLSKELICPCPSCGGKALDQCEPQCHDGQVRRDAIAAQLKQGKSREQVMQFMSATYGAAILGEPPREGWGILSLAMPLACMAMGVVPLLWFTRRSQSAKSSKSSRSRRPARRNAAAIPPEDARVAAALQDFDY